MNIATDVIIVSQDQRPPLETALRAWLKANRVVFMKNLNEAVDRGDWGAVRELTVLVGYTDTVLRIIETYPRG